MNRRVYNRLRYITTNSSSLLVLDNKEPVLDIQFTREKFAVGFNRMLLSKEQIDKLDLNISRSKIKGFLKQWASCNIGV